MKRPKAVFGVEIKSCLRDFTSDAKWAGYLDFCHYFCFAVPAADTELLQEIVRKIPSSVGILTVDCITGMPRVLNYPVQWFRLPKKLPGVKVPLIYETLYERAIGWSGNDQI